MASVVLRLAWRNVRHRPWQSVLLLLALCLSTTTLSLALALEDGLATTLGARPGDTIILAGKRVAVLGTAMSVAVMPYPLDTRDRGFAWAGAATASAIDPGAVRRAQVTSQLRLSNPDDAPAFARGGPEIVLPDGFDASVYEFQLLRRGADGKLSNIALALGLTATLLAGLTLSTVGVIVAERMAAQIRRVGALKAVGVTPLEVTLVLLAEYAVMAVLAAAVGLGVSTRAAPLVAGNLRILYGAPEPPAITAPRAALVLAVAVVLVVVVFSAGMLIALAAVNSAVAAVFAARDSARNHAILRALGATPRQTAVAFVIAQLGAGVAACAAGIPLGILLFNTLGGRMLAPATLATSAYLALGLIAVAVYACIVAVPARVLAAQRITLQLCYE